MHRDLNFAFVDFGAERDRLKPAGRSTVVETFGYMAPEQFQALRRAELSDEDAEAWADEVATREAEQWEPPEAWKEEGRNAAAKRRR